MMQSEIIQFGFVVSVFASAVRIGTILLLAALGEMVVERAGVMNLSVEGTMLTGALTGFLAAFFSGSLWVGVLVGAVGGALMSAIFALLTVLLHVDQTVSGLTINIFASGLTYFLYRTVFPDVALEGVPNLIPFSNLHIPLLSDIPVLGDILFSHQWFSYFSLLMALVISFFLYRTRRGLVLRSMGENPRVADMKGYSITRYRFFVVLFGGLMAGLAGSILTLGSAGLFVADMTAGRGWLAIAIVIFGDWKPGQILLGSLFFGLIDALQLQVQALGMQLPSELFQAMPYIFTVIAVFIGRTRKNTPLSLGEAYVRE